MNTMRTQFERNLNGSVEDLNRLITRCNGNDTAVQLCNHAWDAFAQALDTRKPKYHNKGIAIMNKVKELIA